MKKIFKSLSITRIPILDIILYATPTLFFWGPLALAQITALVSFNSSISVQPPAGMFLWLDGNCITNSSCTSQPSNGATITSWADKSGMANNASLSAGPCTFNTNQINGQPAVNFAACKGDLSVGIAWQTFGGTALACSLHSDWIEQLMLSFPEATRLFRETRIRPHLGITTLAGYLFLSATSRN